jgi:hypothetical protein
MTGVPWALTQLPMQRLSRPEGNILGAPPVRKNNKTYQAQGLGTINERERMASPPTSPNSISSWRSGAKSPPNETTPPISKNLGVRKDASTSTTDLTEDGDKKVQKGQINTLAKMLSGWKR